MMIMTDFIKVRKKTVFAISILCIYAILATGCSAKKEAVNEETTSQKSAEHKNESKSMTPEQNGSKTLDEAVSIAIKNSVKNDKKGELPVEGHIVLDTEEKDGKVFAYVISTYSIYSFENKTLTEAYAGGFSSVITFTKNKKNEYLLKNLKASGEGGNDYLTFIKNNFPEGLWDKALPKKSYYPEMVWKKVFEEKKYYDMMIEQKKGQVNQYLKSTGGNADVSDIIG